MKKNELVADNPGFLGYRVNISFLTENLPHFHTHYVVQKWVRPKKRRHCLSRHTFFRMDHFHNWPPIDRLVCDTLYGVEGRNRDTLSMVTNQVVRFGMDVYMDLPSTLDLTNVGSGYTNPNLGIEFKATDSGPELEIFSRINF